MPYEAIVRDECRTPASPEGLEIMQVASDARMSQAYYCDCPTWTSDSTRFVFRREAGEGGTPPAGLWLCDVRDRCRSEPVLDFIEGDDAAPRQSKGAILAPDGTCAYHLVRIGRTLELRRVDVATRREDVLCTAPMPLRATGLATISADGERLLMGAFLGDGQREGAPWGAYIFDVRRGTYWPLEFGNGFRNMHAQYSHDPDPARSHDILLNVTPDKFSDGSWLTPPDGSWRWQNLPPPVDQGGTGYAVVRDDGTDWRVVPVGRDPHLHNGGLNVWRGREYAVVTSAYHHPPGRWRAPLLAAAPIPVATRDELLLGQHHPKARWVDLTRKLARADSCHFGFNASGRHFVSDTDGYATPPYSFVYVGTYVAPPGEEPFVRTRYLLLPRTSWRWQGPGSVQASHPHPYLSPDGRYVVFQSDFTGKPQVHVAWGFEYP